MERIEQRAPRPSAVVLGRVFLLVGATAFGGLGATLALLERELVDRRKVLSLADITEALTYTKLLPGSTGLQVVSYLSYKLGGWPGSAIATAAYLLPSAVIMLAAAALYVAVATLSGVNAAITGLAAAVVGILVATTYRLGKTNIKEPWTLAVAIIACGAGAFLGVNAALLVIVAGLIGMYVQRSDAKRSRRTAE